MAPVLYKRHLNNDFCVPLMNCSVLCLGVVYYAMMICIVCLDSCAFFSTDHFHGFQRDYRFQNNLNYHAVVMSNALINHFIVAVICAQPNLHTHVTTVLLGDCHHNL